MWLEEKKLKDAGKKHLEIARVCAIAGAEFSCDPPKLNAVMARVSRRIKEDAPLGNSGRSGPEPLLFFTSRFWWR